jgi:hypothetical protein
MLEGGADAGEFGDEFGEGVVLLGVHGIKIKSKIKREGTRA